MPTFGSLFAGIGGIDLGLERAGWECRWQVEWSGWCQHNLGHHFDVPAYGDITAIDWSTIEPVDLLVGGFPCQPVSDAGKKRAQDDERWLWPEFARAIRDLRPRLVLVENVPGLLTRGMGDVLGDLSALGFDAEWDVIPAAAVGAPHLRERVWIVAHDDRRHGRASGSGQAQGRSAGHALDGGPSDAASRAVADPHGLEHEGDPSTQRRPATPDVLADADEIGRRRWSGVVGPGWRRQPPNSGWWATEPDVGRVAHGVPARVDRLRALGNAVVPQVVEVIGRRLLEVMEKAA